MISTSRPSAPGQIIGPLAALALMCGLLALAAPAKAAFPGANGKIAFSKDIDTPTCGDQFQPVCDSDIFTINPDGTGLTNLTNDPTSIQAAPAWSADGRKIAFTVNDFGDIAVMNADGSGVTQITSDPDRDFGMAWSPDGRRIAFQSWRGSGFNNVFVMNADGSGITQLTGRPASEDQGSGPAWSPDGTKIAYTSDLFGRCDSEIHVMNPDGTNKANVTNDPLFDDKDSDWSPDGQKLVYARAFKSQGCGGHDFDWRIAVMNADGTGKTDLALGEAPFWSPDGRRIGFASRSGLVVMNADGSNQTTFSNARSGDWQPVNPAPYPRPIGASPMRLSLVPAFTPCDEASANATHAAPLSGASCSPPVPRSSLVAVGPRSLGYARLIVLGNGACAPFDSTHCYPDVTIRVNITDVRSGTPTGPDYGTPSAQDLTGIATLPGNSQGSTTQITDQNNQSVGDPSGPYDKSATVVPLKFPVPIDCVAVANPIDGSVCSAQTTANTLVPGSAVAGKRAIWELGQVQVLDQGANGTPGDSDDQVFEAQGVFVP